MKKGFTLIELLIVIGILAILAVVSVLVLNPAQLLAQARDSQRISDLGTIKSAISLWLATTTSTPVFTSEVGRFTVSGATCGMGSCTDFNATTTVDGNGWVGVNLTQTTGGSSLSSLPLDPTNNTTYFYAFRGVNDSVTFELNARLESERHRGLMKTDGGEDSACTDWTGADCFYEVGTDADLNL